MTSGFALFLLGAAFFAVIAFGGKEAPRAMLYFAWVGMALWAVGTVIWAAGRLLLPG